jgi:hypothetical protein
MAGPQLLPRITYPGSFMHYTLSRVTTEIDKALPVKIAAVLKLLLEQKHLYQSVIVDFESNLQDLAGKLPPGEQSTAITHGLGQLSANWHFLDPSSNSKSPQSDGGVRTMGLIIPPEVNVFCSSCSRTEAFNCLGVHEFSAAFSRSHLSHSRPALQGFLFTYICQSCKTFPEAFLVRRENNTLILSGRTPIEHVDVPSAVPRKVRRFYSGAIVAHQSGQTLAGLLLLRTLVEQWCILAMSGTATPMDVPLDEYMASLPEDFKTRFPSMRDLYSELTADIHAATGSSDLFDSVKDRLLVHFEARRLFKLPDGVI